MLPGMHSTSMQVKLLICIANADASKAEAASLIDELTKYLNELDEANASTKTVTGSAPVTGYKYNAQVTVTFDSKGKVVSVVDNNTQPSKNSSTYWNLLSGLTLSLIHI